MDYDLCVDNKIIIHKSPQIYYFSIRIVFFVKNKIAIRLVYSRFHFADTDFFLGTSSIS